MDKFFKMVHWMWTKDFVHRRWVAKNVLREQQHTVLIHLEQLDNAKNNFSNIHYKGQKIRDVPYFLSLSPLSLIRGVSLIRSFAIFTLGKNMRI